MSWDVDRGSRNNISGWVAYRADLPGRPGVVFASHTDALHYAALKNDGHDDDATNFAEKYRETSS